MVFDRRFIAASPRYRGSASNAQQQSDGLRPPLQDYCVLLTPSFLMVLGSLAVRAHDYEIDCHQRAERHEDDASHDGRPGHGHGEAGIGQGSGVHQDVERLVEPSRGKDERRDKVQSRDDEPHSVRQHVSAREAGNHDREGGRHPELELRVDHGLVQQNELQKLGRT